MTANDPKGTFMILELLIDEYNTKKVSTIKDMVYIRARHQFNNDQLQIESIYDDADLQYLSIDGQRIELDSIRFK